MLILVDAGLLQRQEYGRALRQAADQLSAKSYNFV